MGQPVSSNVETHYAEYIGIDEQTEGIETSKYLQEKKIKMIP